MTKSVKNICIIGAGHFGTAFGNMLTNSGEFDVTLLSIEENVVKAINETHYNLTYFPHVKLSKKLTATSDINILKDADIIFIAIPSYIVIEYVKTHKHLVKKDAVIVNLAKGFNKDSETTIIESLEELVSNQVCSLKGPTFAREVVNNVPTAMTLGARDERLYGYFKEIFKETNLTIDYSSDVIGVELLSILKNIYAIVIGIVDAHFNSPNLRFFILTKAFNEIRGILKEYGGKEETLFNYCGLGDFALTALNDLSRNRTLGLFIGKGFMKNEISNDIVLEGKVAVNVFCQERYDFDMIEKKYPIMAELYKVFSEKDYVMSDFVWKIVEDKD
ncbi:MAG: NAD(P)H-dependent glycerol-3-phosphate dehydrogenase [Bacteroidota bacterium]|nr:NAD(P)H-dependent glycerol-3-phosphate dehydrogenase [Bacteroidota bacterium]